VCLKADGSVQVIAVLQGIRYGLDEEAARVAAGVQFVPELRDGIPVDSTHLLSIDFQLADRLSRGN
jgi:Gram-negative bacterial TonB protein C-terminal